VNARSQYRPQDRKVNGIFPGCAASIDSSGNVHLTANSLGDTNLSLTLTDASGKIPPTVQALLDRAEVRLRAEAQRCRVCAEPTCSAACPAWRCCTVR
jgi:hypothetical protein